MSITTKTSKDGQAAEVVKNKIMASPPPRRVLNCACACSHLQKPSIALLFLKPPLNSLPGCPFKLNKPFFVPEAPSKQPRGRKG